MKRQTQREIEQTTTKRGDKSHETRIHTNKEKIRTIKQTRQTKRNKKQTQETRGNHPRNKEK
jgi:hypothetical protein